VNKIKLYQFYGLEVCPVNASEILSFDFVTNVFFMKLFQTNHIDTVYKFLTSNMPTALIPEHVNKEFS